MSALEWTTHAVRIAALLVLNVVIWSALYREIRERMRPHAGRPPKPRSDYIGGPESRVERSTQEPKT